MKKILGIILVCLAVVIVVATFFPLAKNEITYQVHKNQTTKDTQTSPISPEFSIIIDKLGINAKVVKNVDPYDVNIYQKALTQGVAHAKGTVLPGENGNIFIFSHSSENFYNAVRYNSIFYLLTKLEMGDKITIFYEGKSFDYHVSLKQIVDPTDTKYLTAKSDKPQLTLMTCYPPGTSIKRFIVVAN